MGLRFIYGKAGSGKSQLCFDEIAYKIKTEKKIYMVTPEQFSYTAEKKLVEAVGNKAVFNAEVITLSRMAKRIQQEVGGKKEALTRCGKAMLVFSIFNQNKNFKFLSKTDENVDLGIRTITEFKKHGITVQNLKDEIEKTTNLYLKTKLQDMAFLYEKFEEKIQENYIEETDSLTNLSQSLEQTDFAKDAIFYFDEFAGFTYPEYQVIKELIKQAKQVNITITTDNLELPQNPDIDVFYDNKKTIKRLKKLVEENDLCFEKPVYLEKQPRFCSPELQHLEQNLFSIKSTKWEKRVENINLFLAKNPYSEVEQVAKQITKLVRENNMRYRDIAIIAKNGDEYSSLARAIFPNYNIPIFIDEKRELSQNSVVQYVLSIFEVFNKNFSRESVFQYLKSGYSKLEQEDIFELENYCVKWGIKQNKWKQDFKREQDEDKKKKEEYFNELRKQIIMPLLELKDNLQKNKETESITKIFYEFLQSQDIEKTLFEKIDKLQEKGLLDLAKEQEASYKIIIQILDEMVAIFKNDQLTIDQYSKILKVGLKNSGLGKIPGTADQVILGSVDRSRSHKVKAIFILGLNDGNFPSIRKDEGFFGDEDRKKLKEDGIELAKGTLEQLYEENFNIYKAFTTAENQIYLSYVSSDKEGKSLRPSTYVNKIKRLFPMMEEKSDVINKTYEITMPIATYEQLLEKIAQKRDGAEMEPLWKTVYNYYKSKNEWQERLQKDLKGLNYTNLPKTIDTNTIEKLYGNQLKTSISKLEQYRRCPFSYYLQYGLKLKEKEELKVQNFDTGSFMHEIIDGFFNEVREQNIELPSLLVAESVLTEEQEQGQERGQENLSTTGITIEKLVDQVVDEKLNFGKKYRFAETANYKILVKRLKRIVSKALKYIIEGLVYSDFNVKGTEMKFGPKGDYKPIILTLDDGKRIEITGKIDRIDTATSEDGNYLRIIDYKSSAKNIDLNEVYAGLQIQLLTYLDAVCKEEDFMPAGVLYFSLLEQMVKSDKKITEEKIEEELKKQFKMKGLILADVKVIKMQDNSLVSGTSKIIPAGITSSGQISEKVTNGVDQEEFKVLQKYISQTIKAIGKEIFGGNIEIMPYYKKGRKPCEYCPYHSICGFDVRNEENHYRYIPNRMKDDVIATMRKEVEND